MASCRTYFLKDESSAKIIMNLPVLKLNPAF